MAHCSPATVAYVLLSAMALLATASPVRRVRQDHSNSLQDVISGLWATRTLAQKNGIDMSMFVPVCQLTGYLDTLQAQRITGTADSSTSTSLTAPESETIDAILAVTESLKNTACSWANSIAGNILAESDGDSCSLDKLKQFCIRVDTYRISKSASDMMSQSYPLVPVSSCSWVEQNLSNSSQFVTIRRSVCGY